MKKIISILLTLCLSLSVMAAMTACSGGNESENNGGENGGTNEENGSGTNEESSDNTDSENDGETVHEHSFKSEWVKNKTHHWHECEGVNCLETSDMAEHSWTEGELTEATEESNGEQIYICSVCGATRSEIIEFTGVSEEKWLEAIAREKFHNVTINYTFENDEMTQDHVVKVTEDRLYRNMIITMVVFENPITLEKVFVGEDYVVQRDMFLNIFLALLAERDNFVWDSESGLYIAPEEVTTRVEGTNGAYGIEVMTNGKVKFDQNGNIEYFSCTLDETTYNEVENTHVVGDVTWTFSDYGTTVVE